LAARRRRRRWAALALLAAVFTLWSWQSSAAEPLPCHAQPGSLATELCERLQLMHDFCGSVEAAARSHCQTSLLASDPLACDDVDGHGAAACRRARASIERCVAYGPSRIDGCLRRSLGGLVRFTSHRQVTADAIAP
jgi:hypothetical protein